jgi:hypothetical protein
MPPNGRWDLIRRLKVKTPGDIQKVLPNDQAERRLSQPYFIMA